MHILFYVSNPIFILDIHEPLILKFIFVLLTRYSSTSLKNKILELVRILHKDYLQNNYTCTAQEIKFSINDFFSKFDQVRSFLRIWSHLLKKSLMEDFIFCAVMFMLKINDSLTINYRL